MKKSQTVSKFFKKRPSSPGPNPPCKTRVLDGAAEPSTPKTLREAMSSSSPPNTDPDPPKKKISKPAQLLLDSSVADAQQAIENLIAGYDPDPAQKNFQPSSLNFPPAIRTPTGCVLAQKKPNVCSVTFAALRCWC